MNRARFFTLIGLSGVIALCIVLQVLFVHIAKSDANRLKITEDSLQQGQMCFNRLQQFAQRIAQVAQQQQDQALKDLLVRQHIQVTAPPAPSGSTTTTPTSDTSTTH